MFMRFPDIHATFSFFGWGGVGQVSRRIKVDVTRMCRPSGETSTLSLTSHHPGLGSGQGHFLLPIYKARAHRMQIQLHHPKTIGKQVREDTPGRGTHSRASDSCSLVRFGGWWRAVMLQAPRAGRGRRACRGASWARLTKAPVACQPWCQPLCQPLLFNQI